MARRASAAKELPIDPDDRQAVEGLLGMPLKRRAAASGKFLPLYEPLRRGDDGVRIVEDRQCGRVGPGNSFEVHLVVADVPRDDVPGLLYAARRGGDLVHARVVGPAGRDRTRLALVGVVG